MGLNLGKSIAVSTSYVKSNPAVPVYKGEESPENLYAVIDFRGYGWLVSLDRSIYIMYSPRRGIYGTTRSPGRNSYDRSAAFA